MSSLNLSISSTCVSDLGINSINGSLEGPIRLEYSQPFWINATITETNQIIEVNVSGTWQNGDFANISIINIPNPYYNIPASFIEDGEKIFWRYYAKDNANNVGEGRRKSRTRKSQSFSLSS